MSTLDISGIDHAVAVASGGSALIYRATHGDRTVAVKVLRGLHGSEVARRFARERAAAEVLADHPGIIDLVRSGITGAGEPYIIMPYFPAGSLQDELDRSGPRPLPEVIADICAAAEAVTFAHSRGVLHRNLKPGNLLRADDGSVVVTDFGIARVSSAHITSATLGANTPLYAAPEVLAGSGPAYKATSTRWLQLDTLCSTVNPPSLIARTSGPPSTGFGPKFRQIYQRFPSRYWTCLAKHWRKTLAHEEKAPRDSRTA